MSNPYGTPSTSRTNGRATQPPLGPSLSTPHRSPYPSSLRPSLFHARPSPLVATTVSLSPATALAQPTSYATPAAVHRAGRLVAPQNTPSSAYAPRAATVSAPLPVPAAKPASNPYDALPASAFDSFVSSLTSSIRSALTPPDAEAPSQRRKREREERQREREEAQAERERAQLEREEQRKLREQEELEQEMRAREEDVFGEIKAVAAQEEEEEDDRDEARMNGGPYDRGSTVEVFDEGVQTEDFAQPSADESTESTRYSADESTRYSPLPDNLSLRSTPAALDFAAFTHDRAPSATPVQQQDDEIVLSSSPAPASPAKTGKPLFVPRAPESATDEDANPGDVDGNGDEAEVSFEFEGSAEEGSVDGAHPVGVQEQDYSEEHGEPDLEVQDDAYPAAELYFHEPPPPPTQQEQVADDDPSHYGDPFDRPLRYQFGSDEEQYVHAEQGAEDGGAAGWDAGEEGETSGEYVSAGEGEESGMEQVEEVEYEEYRDAEEEPLPAAAAGPETIDLLDSSSDEDEDALPPPSSIGTRRAQYGASSPPPPSAPVEESETDLSDRQLEAQLSREAKRHNALPRDTPDAPDRMVDEMDGTYPAPSPALEAEAVSSRSPSPATAAEADEDERELIREAHRHNALPRDTPDAPDRMVETMEGSEWKAVAEQDEDEVMLDLNVEPEGAGDTDSAAYADVEDADEGADTAPSRMGSVELEGADDVPASTTAELERHQRMSSVDRMVLPFEEAGPAVADAGEDEERNAEQAVFREGEPGEDLEMGRESSEEEPAKEVNPLEALYADEDSDDVLPRVSKADKGKGRAPPTPSTQPGSGDEDDDGYASPTASDVDIMLAEWDSTAFETYDPDELIELILKLRFQLSRAAETESVMGRLIAKQLVDAEALFRQRMGIDTDEELEFGEDDAGSGRDGEEYGEEEAMPDERDFDSGGEGGDIGEGEVIMPSEMQDDDEEPAQHADRSAFDDERTSPSSSTLPFADNAVDLSRAEADLSAVVDQMVSHHTSAIGAPSSELFIPSSALTGEPRPALSSHFQNEIGPRPDFDSRVDLPASPTQTNVDAPLESQERNQEESVEEMIEEKEGEVAPLAETQDVLHAVSGEQADGPAGPSEAGGILVVDDDEPFAETAASASVAEERAASLPPFEDRATPSGGSPRLPTEAVSAPAPSPPPADLEAPAPASPSRPAADLPHAVPASSSRAEAMARDPSPSPTPDPIVPVHGLQEPHLSSHFQLEPGPAPSFDSQVKLDVPPTMTREEDVMDSDEEREQEEDRLRRNGEAEETKTRALPLERLVDASKSEQRQQVDVEQPQQADGGLMIVDDDDQLPASPAAATAVEVSPPPSSPKKVVLGATPPPADAAATTVREDGSPPIVDGVAPPQNPALVPEPLPATPNVASPASGPLSPAPPPTTDLESAAPASFPSPAPPHSKGSLEQDEIRFDDFVELDGSEGEEGEEDQLAQDEADDGDLTPDRANRFSPSAATAGGALGLAPGEDVGEMSDAVYSSSDNERDDEAPETDGKGEKSAPEEIMLGSSSDVAVEEGQQPSATREQAPSSEPIDYRSEDEREIEESEAMKQDEPALLVPESASPPPPFHSPLRVHDVLEPGEWSPDRPIRFGAAHLAEPPAAAEGQVEVADETGELVSSPPAQPDELQLSTPLEEDPQTEDKPELVEGVQAGDEPETVVEGAAQTEDALERTVEETLDITVEMDFEGGDEALLPTDVQSARGASVAASDLAEAATEIACELLDSTSANTPARSVSPASPAAAVEAAALDLAEQTASNVALATSEPREPAASAEQDPSLPEDGEIKEPTPAPEEVGETAAKVEPEPPAELQAPSPPEEPVSSVDFAYSAAPQATAEAGTTEEAPAAGSHEAPKQSTLAPDLDGPIKPFGSGANTPVAEVPEPPLEPAFLVPALELAQPADDSEDELRLIPSTSSAAPPRPASRPSKKGAAARAAAEANGGDAPRRRSSRLHEPETAERPPVSHRRTRSTAKDDEHAPSPLPNLAEPAPASPVRRSSRLSAPPPPLPAPAPAASASSSKAKRRRKSAGDDAEDPSASASPAKRFRRSGPSKLRDGGRASSVEEEDEVHEDPPRTSVSPGPFRVHHHHHHNAPPVGEASESGPVTRSRCAFQRLEIRSKENPDAPPYLFNIPACALSSTLARETMEQFAVEDLGPVDHHDSCEGVPLGGPGFDADAATRMEERHSALVPDSDVVEAVRRIVGTELWDEGVCEVVPREEAEHAKKKDVQVTPAKGKKRAAPEEGEGKSGKKRK
ncbi:hypothetical protein JCM10213_008946 [Rhodosporidiobolus nylandii]